MSAGGREAKDAAPRPLDAADLELLDYVITKAIESCTDTRRKAAGRQRELKVGKAA